jgi:hypothetical protein
MYSKLSGGLLGASFRGFWMFFGLMTAFIRQKIIFFAKLVGCGWM